MKSGMELHKVRPKMKWSVMLAVTNRDIYKMPAHDIYYLLSISVAQFREVSTDLFLIVRGN